MARCAAESAHLVVFDRDERRDWNEKIFPSSVAVRTGRPDLHMEDVICGKPLAARLYEWLGMGSQSPL